MGAPVAIGAFVGAAGSVIQGSMVSRAYRESSASLMEQARANADMIRLGADVAAAQYRASAQYNASVAKNNAIISENNALAAERDSQVARQQAQYEADRIRDRNRRIEGRARAIVGSSGITMEGSPEDVVLDSAIQGELDALLVKYLGALRSNAFMQEAANHQYSAKLSRHEASVLMTQGENSANIALWEGAMRARASIGEANLRAEDLRRQGRLAMGQGLLNAGTTLLGASFSSTGGGSTFTPPSSGSSGLKLDTGSPQSLMINRGAEASLSPSPRFVA